jgi:hypothetical protein
MKGFANAVLAAVTAVALSAGSANAKTVTIDFSTGMAGPGGLLGIGPNAIAVGILIDTVTITVDSLSGVFDVDGPAPCHDGLDTCGILNFDINGISLFGSIPDLGILAPTTTLLSGEVSVLNVLLNNGVTASVTASGRDAKARDLLLAINVDPATQFTFFAFATGVNGTGQGSPYTVLFADVTNRSVPEPGSVALVGTGLLGIASSTWRRFRKKD